MAMIKRLSIFELKQQQKVLERSKKVVGNRPYIREELSQIRAELKCRINPTVQMPKEFYNIKS